MRIGMQGKIVLFYSLLVLFAMQLGGVYLVNSLENYYLRNYANNQVSQAELLGNFLRRYLVEEGDNEEDISSLMAEFGGDTVGTETMVLDRYGRMVASSGQQPTSILGERVIQDDILMALAGNRVETIRADPNTEMRYYYLALPVKEGSSVVGVVFLRGSLEHIYLTLQEIKFILISGWGIVLGIAVVIGFLLARTITRPVREITSGAASMAAGDFSKPIKVRSNDEIGELGRMFNFMSTQLQSTLQEISAENSKVEAILNYMTDGIIAFNREGRIIHLNPAAQKLLSWAGCPVDLFRPGTEVLAPLFDESKELSLMLQSQAPTTREVELKYPQEKTLQLHFAPFWENEDLKGMLVVIHDITRERTFSRMQQEFVANVSHELKTPLTTVKNYVETLLNGAKDNPKVRDRFLYVLENETERMIKLVRDLLALSKMDYEETHWTKIEVDMENIVNEVVEQARLECEEKGIYLYKNFPGEEINVYLDKDKIKQVVLNLLDNAIKFSPPSGYIEITLFRSDDSVTVAVKNSGANIPPEEINRVFERFYRVDKTRSRESGGTGLGLPIAKQIVEAHGGEIKLHSSPGEGTEVSFTLPLQEVQDKDEQKST